MSSPIPTRTIRNADLSTLVSILRSQEARKLDVVVPADSIRATQGHINVHGLDPILDTDGVSDPNGLYLPTKTADNQIGAKFGIPSQYMTTLRQDNLPLYDANVNGWADLERGDNTVKRNADPTHTGRSVLLRLLQGTDPTDSTNSSGILRAVLSDRFNGSMDNIDVVMAFLKGAREAGLDAHNIGTANLSDDRLYLRVEAPEINVLAPELLKGYRSPFTGAEGADNPVVSAGILLKNSETGNGALTITPELKVQVCSNGLVITTGALRQVHLGTKLEQGQVRWSADTIKAEENLLMQKIKDAVSSFLTPAFLQKAVDDLTGKASVPLTKPLDTVRVIARELRFTEAETEGLLDHFVRGAQMTSGGVLQATTSFCQTIENVDRAHDIQAMGLRALDMAARIG